MDIKRLYAFARIVDIGSITRAATILRIAQPALSQQIAALEAHFGKPLLLRSKRGVVPTEAGRILYAHCQQIIKQMERAELDISRTSEALTGFVSVTFAPLSLGPTIAVQLMAEVKRDFPGIMLHVNENVGGVISEQVMTGKTDLALIFDPGGLPSLSFETVRTEELYLVTHDQSFTPSGEGGLDPAKEVRLADAITLPMVLPRRIHTVRQVLDTTLARAGLTVQVVAETESISLLAGAVSEGLGSTILPISAAHAIRRRLPDARILRIRKPNMKVNMAICVSGQLPLSEPAAAVRDRLRQIAQNIVDE
ncbi:LysR substrate-binding domain-containing protein [Ketogulonicigenium vulgare]|nr:LysR substrate-binding domain-containing protein [Ketogulonicigenium vulgare]ADO43012.1 LysR family transcriptional regulator [Ketogulonicigenium vulgare Y25]ALJ82345.1 LysR family transcriptional regulator [Ketogulonicigenium vulgare]ANW34068.1 LysR family transcriptional regulator [Ketogulonicigenium vulgare]AOZ54922.1 transcriptional regulator, LysR family protein [Ketogulonicigenium vulgare]